MSDVNLESLNQRIVYRIEYAVSNRSTDEYETDNAILCFMWYTADQAKSWIQKDHWGQWLMWWCLM